MSLPEKIQDIAEKIEEGNINDLRIGLNQLADISKEQLQANKSTITTPIQNLAEAVQRNVINNMGQIQENQQLQRLVRTATSNLPRQIKQQIAPLLKRVEQEAATGALTNQMERQIKQSQKILEEKIQQTSSDLIPFRPKDLVVPQLSTSLTPIQQSVARFSPLFSLSPKPVRPDQLPDTMKFLSQYARIQGKIPVSTVSHSGGSAYVGVQSVDRGDGITQLIAYPKNEVPKTNLPSIPIQLQYYANRTINSWNKYVRDESSFLNYFNKVNTPENRLKYVQNQFAAMNLTTFAAEALATLIFYYIYLPMQKFAVGIANNSRLSANYQNYLLVYEVGDSIKVNPFLLNNRNGRQLAKKLFQQSGTFVQVLEKIKTFLISLKTNVNSPAIDKLLRYPDDRREEALTFMKQNGIDQKLADTILGSLDWSSVKRKKFIVVDGTKNSQMLQIANNIVTKKSGGKPEGYRLTWGQTSLICHDYIWQWKNS